MLKYIKQNLTKDKLLNMSGACYWRIGLCGNPSKYCYNLTKKKKNYASNLCRWWPSSWLQSCTCRNKRSTNFTQCTRGRHFDLRLKTWWTLTSSSQALIPPCFENHASNGCALTRSVLFDNFVAPPRVIGEKGRQKLATFSSLKAEIWSLSHHSISSTYCSSFWW